MKVIVSWFGKTSLPQDLDNLPSLKESLIVLGVKEFYRRISAICPSAEAEL